MPTVTEETFPEVKVKAESKIPLWGTIWLVVAGMLIIVFLTWLTVTHAAFQPAGQLQPELTPRAYLPFISRAACIGNVVVNGSFEQGDEGWHQYTSGTGWKDHDLIGSDAEGFDPYDGHYAAMLGGYEGVWDVLTQTVTMPTHGQLSYWWQMHTYETEIFHDNLCVDLLTLDGDLVAVQASHNVQGPEGIWQQDVVDVSAYAGQTLILRFHAYNDNYYFSWFDIDQVCLRSVW